MELNFRLPFWSSLLLIPVLILSACAPAAPTDAADDPVITERASPTTTPAPSFTPSPLSPTPPNTLQPTQPSYTPTQVPVPARLAVLTSLAKIVRGGNTQRIQQAESADIQRDDQIELVKLIRLSGQDQQSYSLLQFRGLVNVELLGYTKLSLVDARQGPEGPAEVTLELTVGHMFVHLSEQEFSHFTVETPIATIKALTSGAEFDVCRTEDLTCVMVKRGVVEIVAQGRREIVNA